MITKIELKNFQAHKHLIIEPSKGVTTIIGPSDSGKSAIMRAIKWVCLNQPAGNAFMRHGKKSVSVSLTINGTVVKRLYNNGTNAYELNGKRYAAFGRNVPEPVAQFLRMSDVNFQGQHDAPFWFSQTAGAVSRELNQIVNLELVDSTLSNLSSMLRTSRAVVSEHTKQLSTAKQERKKLRFVKQLNADLTAAKQQFAISTNANSKLTKMMDYIQEASKHQATTDNTRAVVLHIRRVLELGDVAIKYAQQTESLSDKLSQAKRMSKIAKTKIPKTKRLDTLATTVKQTHQKLEKITKYISNIDNITMEASTQKSLLDKVRAEINQLTKGRCPLCGSKMKI